MSDEKAVASEFDGVWNGSFASPETHDSATELLDAVHRISFETWWTRVHRAGESHDSGRIPRRHTQKPKS